MSDTDPLNDSEAPRDVVRSKVQATEPESSFHIHTLKPEYNAEDHELYVGYLRDELSKPARKAKESEGHDDDLELRPRNIALTGSYGSGKSSILSKIVDELSERVVSVSLSTLGSEEPSDEETLIKDPLKTPAITNAIQKEIVKQLLYREKPSNVPGSRYRRIEGFRRGRAFGFSLLVAVGLTALSFLTGATTRAEGVFGNTVGPNITIYVLLFILLVLLAQGLQVLFHNRVWIEKLSSGPASISLTSKTESFFDKYLDEIVYFFEANSYDIVVFEDLDRFNDPYIFETLRELNTLLNNSKQIDPKVVTFVYAIKDSIFEQLGKLSINGVQMTDDEIRQLAITNRTKFFDVVIPVVPFISHRNARDLISKEMKRSGFIFDKPLVDLISRHMVDMRLIKNVHNEFGVFQQKILAPGHLDELKSQPLFAMVVFKNLNMSEFEKVKEGNSKLDDLYDDFRALVNQQIAATDRAIRNAQGRARKLDSIESRRTELGDGLEEYVTRLLRAVGQTIENATFTLTAGVTLEELRGTEFWKTWIENPELMLTVSYPASVPTIYGQQVITQSLTLSLDAARVALADRLALDEWETSDRAQLDTDIAELTNLRKFLTGATMKELAGRDEFQLTSDHGNESFTELAERHLGKGLSLDLVKAGYIDRNFSLYVSMYYDDTVTARARNYILHSVEAGKVDINAEIGTSKQIEAMLDEVGDSIFAERSIYNIQLLDHLLAKGDRRLDRSIRMLAGDGIEERETRAAYFSSGSQIQALVTRLAPLWTDIFGFLRSDESVAEDQRVALTDAALAATADKMSYDVDATLGAFFRAKAADLGTLTGSKPITSPAAVIAVLERAGVLFESLQTVSEALKAGAIKHALYDLTADNLIEALKGEKNLSLDNIRAIDEDVFQYVAGDLAAYLGIQEASEATEHTIDDYKSFVSVLNELTGSSEATLTAIVEGAAPVTVTKIASLNEKLWPIVAATGHLEPSYSNVIQYIAKFGAIDANLGVTLKVTATITELGDADEPGKRSLAIAIVASTALGCSKRVELVQSLGLASPLIVSELHLGDHEPDLTGQLLTAGLIGDSAETFAELNDAEWPVQRAYIENSTDFSTYVNEIEFSGADFLTLSQDGAVPDDVKTAIVLNLDEHAESLGRAALDALAEFAVDADVAVGSENLLVMATAGVTPVSLMKLISKEVDSIGLGELLAILGAMPDKYKKLTTTGGHTKIPNTVEDLKLADHLVGVGQVSSRDPHPTGSEFRVNLKAR